ncbi:hypothetical protein P8S53_20445 (plasmid) [Roseinatronobacter sp. S2]|nr:hypothetical protein [Roseinatronobacter sp. S2]WFE77226.1 hypothetical protein P8S53_20445 [Roseinatronobacter sp. S2]
MAYDFAFFSNQFSYACVESFPIRRKDLRNWLFHGTTQQNLFFGCENLHAQFSIRKTIYNALYFIPVKTDTPKGSIIQSRKRGHHLPLLPSSNARPQQLSQPATAITLGRNVVRSVPDTTFIVH